MKYFASLTFLLTFCLQAQTVKVSKTIAVRGKVFDGQGKVYQWKGAGNCGQKEGMPPMFKLYDNAVLKNMTIKGAPDGIHIMGSQVVIDNVRMPDVCEDAVSFKSAKIKRAIIRNSVFENCEDKGISTPKGKDILIFNNEFRNCERAIRLHNEHQDVKVYGNRFYNVGSGIQIDDAGEVFIKDNYIENSKNLVYAYRDALVINQGGNQEGPGVRSIYKIVEGAQMIFAEP